MLFRFVLASALFALLPYLFHAQITSIAYAGTWEDVYFETDSTTFDIRLKSQAEREIFAKKIAKKNSELVQRFNSYKGDVVSAVNRCDRVIYTGIKNSADEYRFGKRTETKLQLDLSAGEIPKLKKRVSDLEIKYDNSFRQLDELSIAERIASEKHKQLLAQTASALVELEKARSQLETTIFKNKELDNLLWYFLRNQWNFPAYPEDCIKETISYTRKDTNMQGAVDDVLDQTEIIKKDTGKPQEGRIIDAGGNGMLVDKGVRLSDLEGCGNTIVEFNNEKEFGLQSTPCPGFVGGLAATPGDYSAHCERFGDPDRFCTPPPGSKVKFLERYLEGDVPIFKTESFFRGIDGTPLSFFCHLLHYGLIKSNDNDQIMMNFAKGSLHPIYKYDNSTQKLECFFLSKEQVGSLFAEFKNAGKMPVATMPDVGKKTSTSASSIDPNSGITTTSVANPDGSRTVTKTDAEGNVLSRKKVR
ncbi:MAG: hypothetical protein V7703_14570 [Hyphomicrobiales bacterium]